MIHTIPVTPILFDAINAHDRERCGVLVVPTGDYTHGDTIVVQDGERVVQRLLTHVLTDATWLPLEHVALSIIDPRVASYEHPTWLKPSPTVFPGPAPGPWFRLSGRPGFVTIRTNAMIAGSPHEQHIGEVTKHNGALVVAAPQLADAARRAYLDARRGHLLSKTTMERLRDALDRMDEREITGGPRPEILDPPPPELYSIALFTRWRAGQITDRFLVVTSDPGSEGDWEEQGYTCQGALLVEQARRDPPLDVFDVPWYPEPPAKKTSQRKKVLNQ